MTNADLQVWGVRQTNGFLESRHLIFSHVCHVIFSEIFSELFYFNYRSSNTWCLLDQGVYSIYKGNTHGDGVDHCSTVANSKSSLWLLPLYFVFWSCKVADTWQMVGWRKKTHEVSGILHGFPSFIQSSVIHCTICYTMHLPTRAFIQ